MESRINEALVGLRPCVSDNMKSDFIRLIVLFNEPECLKKYRVISPEDAMEITNGIQEVKLGELEDLFSDCEDEIGLTLESGSMEMRDVNNKSHIAKKIRLLTGEYFNGKNINIGHLYWITCMLEA